MSNPDFRTIRDTINIVDLALSGVPVDVEIENDAHFAFGVLDGMRITIAAFEHPDLVVGEIFARFVDGDVARILSDSDRVIGMLAGSVAVGGLSGKSQALTEITQ